MIIKKIINSINPKIEAIKIRDQHAQSIYNEKALKSSIQKIMQSVKHDGDQALIKLTEKFDKVKLDSNEIRVSETEIQNAQNQVSDDFIDAITFVKNRVENLSKITLDRLQYTYDQEKNINIKSLVRPIDSVGCYVPGGSASYPTTFIMSCVTSKVAQVPRIAVCIPPDLDKSINALTLATAHLIGIKEIYRIGGAQAIAALTYGTESIKPVKKIVGPGNRYVTMAKMLVNQELRVNMPFPPRIDLPAGPSEVLIIADSYANPRFIALDMIAQAEHGVHSIVGLVTTSKQIVDKVIMELTSLTANAPRNEIVNKSLGTHGFIVVCKDINDVIAFVNEFAPEHLEIMNKNPEVIINKINHAGLILVGDFTPASVSDYGIGTNHILPTNATASVYSGLSVIDFVKIINVVNVSKPGLEKMVNKIKILAESEGLFNHSLAVEKRFKN